MDKLTRAEKRQMKQQRKVEAQQQQQQKNHLTLKNVQSKTQNQETIFKEFINGKNLLIHGLPGTGKTFLSLYLALKEIEQFKDYQRLIIIRSVVPSRDMGFLPGNAKDKAKVYEAPYQAICTELYNRGDAYDVLKNKGVIHFETSSFLRGVTFDNAIVFVDECQNMSYHELCTIMTRVGKNCRIIFSGDYLQSDLKYTDEKQGVLHFMKIVMSMKRYFSTIEMSFDDIVRSGIVKDFIIRKHNYENPKVVYVQPSTGEVDKEQKVFH